ncbi:MAG: hypothetical protein ACO1N8_06230 [Methylophilus sp.]
MSEQEKTIAQSIGQLSGELRVMHQTTMDAMKVIREDLRRMEDSTKENMLQLENRLNGKIDGLGTRVKGLEDEDKKMIEKVSKLSAFGGGIGGALAAGFVELIKRMN